MTKEELKSMFGGIVEHYNHACEKHPFFADKLCVEALHWREFADNQKNLIMSLVTRGGHVTSFAVLHAEMFEIFAAFCEGDYAQARYEVLDAIAVLLRMDDMIRNAQARREEEKPNAGDDSEKAE